MSEKNKPVKKVEAVTPSLPPALLSADAFDLSKIAPQSVDHLDFELPRVTQSEEIHSAMRALPACGVEHNELLCDHVPKAEMAIPGGTLGLRGATGLKLKFPLGTPRGH